MCSGLTKMTDNPAWNVHPQEKKTPKKQKKKRRKVLTFPFFLARTHGHISSAPFFHIFHSVIATIQLLRFFIKRATIL